MKNFGSTFKNLLLVEVAVTVVCVSVVVADKFIVFFSLRVSKSGSICNIVMGVNAFIQGVEKH